MQRSDQLTDVDSLQTEDAVEESTDRSRRGGRLSRFVPSGGRLFSPRTFLAALVLSVGAILLGGAVPVLGLVGRFVGLFLVAFLVGLVSEQRRYLEVGLAAALASAMGFVFGVLTSALFPVGLSVLRDYGIGIAGVGAGAGLLVAVAGHYFGRDLRAGLTRDI